MTSLSILPRANLEFSKLLSCMYKYVYFLSTVVMLKPSQLIRINLSFQLKLLLILCIKMGDKNLTSLYLLGTFMSFMIVLLRRQLTHPVKYNEN